MSGRVLRTNAPLPSERLSFWPQLGQSASLKTLTDQVPGWKLKPFLYNSVSYMIGDIVKLAGGDAADQDDLPGAWLAVLMNYTIGDDPAAVTHGRIGAAVDMIAVAYFYTVHDIKKLLDGKIKKHKLGKIKTSLRKDVLDTFCSLRRMSLNGRYLCTEIEWTGISYLRGHVSPSDVADGSDSPRQ
ncbi:uncharacterized protein BXZ73DRAFT_111571, partial [Epithele typhae]|uniref:uncharacterized protein n=1 Tax=Epithele typhae TaxID=378194 RepID=UPI0020082ADB